MANANLSIVNVTNTFDEWRIRTNNLIEDRNILRNHSYVKDSGNFTVANGTLSVQLTNGGTALNVLGNSNVVIGNKTTTGNLVVLQSATIGNLTVSGNQIVVGDTLSDSNLFVLRANSSVDGGVVIRNKRPTGNAELIFDNSANVWRSTANANAGYTTILTTANVLNSFLSGDELKVPTAAALSAVYGFVDETYSAANSAANTVRVSANGGSTLSAKQLNFINTSSVQVSVVDGVGAASGNANVSFTVTGGAGAQGTQGTTGSGSQGIQGTLGSSGSQGTQGTLGSQGLQGTSGSGSQGTQGTLGGSGSQGTQGTLGSQGTNGSGGTITTENSSSSTYYPLFTVTTSGTLATANVSTTKFSFQPSTGTVTATDFSATSDERLKNISQEISDGVKLVESLRAVEYTWNDTAKSIGVSEDDRKQVGLIAQDAEKLYDTLVTKNENGYFSVSYNKVVPILVQAIKELNDRLKKLENNN